MGDIYYKKLYDLAIKRLVKDGYNIDAFEEYGIETDGIERKMDAKDWETILITDYEEKKQSLIATLKEYAIIKKLWQWMRESLSHTYRTDVEKFCHFIDEKSVMKEYKHEILCYLSTKHLEVKLTSEPDPISFKLIDKEELIMRELREYCTEEEMERIIDMVEVYSQDQYLSQLNQLQKILKGKSFSM